MSLGRDDSRAARRREREGRVSERRRSPKVLGVGSSNAQRANALRRRTRAAAIELLGGQCVRCGFSDPRALQFDHASGDGARDRRGAWSTAYYERICRSALAKEGRYQLLCANCNFIKAHAEGALNGSRPKDALEAMYDLPSEVQLPLV